MNIISLYIYTGGLYYQLTWGFEIAITRIPSIYIYIYKPIPVLVSSNIIRVLNVAQMTPVWPVIQMIHKKGHVDMVGVWKFCGTFSPPNLEKLSNFPFILASQICDALNLNLRSVPYIRNIGSRDPMLRYCMLQWWFGGWAKRKGLWIYPPPDTPGWKNWNPTPFDAVLEVEQECPIAIVRAPPNFQQEHTPQMIWIQMYISPGCTQWSF